jgi:predicted O-linked N-acetylglucosamine transferase (SPINDLY family)
MPKPYAPLLQQLLIEFKNQRLGAAEQIARTILKINSKDLVALQILGLSLAMQDRVLEAIEPLKKAAKEDSKNSELLTNLAKAQHTAGLYREALVTYEQLMKLLGSKPEILTDMGTSCAKLKDYALAAKLFDQAISIDPNYFLAWSNRGNLLAEQNQIHEAITSYEKSIQLNPNYAESWTNLGNALFDLGLYEKSLECHDQALRLNPRYAEALSNKGNAHLEKKEITDAYACYLKAFNEKPSVPYLFGQLYAAKMSLIDWSNLDQFEEDLSQAILNRSFATLPFNALSYPNLELQAVAAQIIVGDRYPTLNQNPVKKIDSTVSSKYRIAYFSSDFSDHPVGILMEQILELHDRNKFDIIGVYLKPLTQSSLAIRLQSLFDEVIFVDSLNLRDAEELLLSKQIDIAVDLNSHTSGGKMQLFANRIAPIQVNYLGYAGTSGANYFDYIICDQTVAPIKDAVFYSEKFAYLPNSFFPADSLVIDLGPIPSRLSQGLPDDAFVFSCFNNAYKFSPAIFDVWARLLNKNTNSVLWLSSLNSITKENLLAEFLKRGIENSRIIFASKVPERKDHLSRLRCADLFLDTPNYNAHATSADSLWAGVPVLTVLGKTFAGRVAASQLKALGMNELIVNSLDEYETLADKLVNSPNLLQELREKLLIARDRAPLFNTLQYVKDLESLFKKMLERACKDLPADHLIPN